MSFCRCPNCGWREDAGDPIEDMLDKLRADCRVHADWVSPDGYVRAETAARLIGLTAKTLANKRSQLDERVPFITRLGKPLYALRSIAALLTS